jgi:hypothetical protein
MELKTPSRTDRERFNLLLSSVRSSTVSNLVHECALCDLALVSAASDPPAPEFVLCHYCKLYFCRECVVVWGTSCPLCYKHHVLGQPNLSGYCHEDLLKLWGSAKPPPKTRELLNPNAIDEVALFAASDSEEPD